MLAWSGGFTFWGESMNHQLNHGYEDHGFTGFREVFVIFAMPTIAANPSKSPFADPTPRQNLKFMRMIGSFHDLQQPTTKRFYPFD